MRNDAAMYLHLMLLRRLAPLAVMLLSLSMLVNSGLIRTGFLWWFGFVYLSFHIVVVVVDHVRLVLRVRRHLLENAKGCVP